MNCFNVFFRFVLSTAQYTTFECFISIAVFGNRNDNSFTLGF